MIFVMYELITEAEVHYTRAETCTTVCTTNSSVGRLMTPSNDLTGLPEMRQDL